MIRKQRPVRGDLQNAAFVQARLLDQFITLARETQDAETGFTRDSLSDLLDSLRDQRRDVGYAVRPRVIASDREEHAPKW